MKVCAKCGETKLENSTFWVFSVKGRANQPCRACWNERERLRHAEKRKLAPPKTKRPRKPYDPEKTRERNRLYWQKNKERLAPKNRQYHRDNREALAEKAKEYRENNAEIVRERAKKQRLKEMLTRGDAVRKYDREYYAEKKKYNPKFRVTRAVKAKLKVLIAAKNTKKTLPSSIIFGWTPEQLFSHLESLFETGMTWENYGKAWHIDHIIPLARVDFQDQDDERLAAVWALSNLAPLWAVDNMQKSKKLHWDLPEHYTNPKMRALYDNRNYNLALAA